ncbi:MAG TPA: DNA repair protein RecO [Candidatus Omnitrophota bacterium]|nr:DNA repair protein RecO [Candidatus Omnitrophota bacterium]HPT07852.1 DNA repair protein RecO [Candidatus Omnitrophota bacterium]
MAIHKTDAIVLKRMDFRETSVIAHFFTRDFGKVHGILKGIRKDPRKFASSVDICTHNEIVFYRSRTSDLHLVSHCDMKNGFGSGRPDMIKTAVASLMMELIHSVMEQEDRNEEVFDLALECLRQLDTTDNPEKVLTIFKIKILTLSGFRPHFDSCVSCQSKIAGETRFSLAMGGLLCSRCYAKDPKARVIFRGTVATLLHIQRNDFKNTLSLGMNKEIKKELNLVLDAFLNFHLEKDFRAQRVLNQLAQPAVCTN